MVHILWGVCMREHASFQLHGKLQMHSKSRVLNITKGKDAGVDLNLRLSTKNQEFSYCAVQLTKITNQFDILCIKFVKFEAWRQDEESIHPQHPQS